MFNFKISGFAAGIAFILSFLIGLLSRAGIPVILLRAFIFGALFFGLSILVYWLLAQFMPEIFNVSEDDLGLSGSRVDISLGDENFAGAFPRDNSENVDDIAGKPSTPARTSPLDQGKNAGYNEDGIEGELDAGPAFDSAEDGPVRAAETLPDLESIAEGTPGSATDVVNMGSFGYDDSKRYKTSSRKPGLEGDFNPKELAQALRTVLKRDEKG